MKRRHNPDQLTLPLFDQTFGASVHRFDERKVRAATLSARVAQMVTTMLKECGKLPAIKSPRSSPSIWSAR